MPQAARPSREYPSDLDHSVHSHFPAPDLLPYTPVSPNYANTNSTYVQDQDSPTIGRSYSARPQHSTQLTPRATPSPIAIVPIGVSASGSSSLASSPHTPLSSSSTRFRKPAPSPLHNSTAISPPNSPSPNNSRFNRPFAPSEASVSTLSSESASWSATKPSKPIETHLPQSRSLDDTDCGTTHCISNSTGTKTFESKQALESSLAIRIPNDRSVSARIRKSGGTIDTKFQAMPGASRMDAVRTSPRNSSIDSAVSSVSTGSSAPKNAQEIASSPADIDKLVKAAGSPEAAIQYLLKEKQSQSQQNAQLWRLVDKQRAMILGLNKDLERALKDKEKYRTKLKEVVHLQTPFAEASSAASAAPESVEKPGPVTTESTTPNRSCVHVPASPSAASDASKLSPIDVSMAPYPITPPADQITNGPLFAVGEILDPEREMPEASSHAFDKYDHDAEERQIEETRRLNDKWPSFEDLPPPPQGEPPAPPPSAATARTLSAGSADDDGLSGFPAPPAPSPRKMPPTPLQLQAKNPIPGLNVNEMQSDSDSEVDEITAAKRGRRRTRHEDDEIREVLIQAQAEARSLSKKSKQNDDSQLSPDPTAMVPTVQALSNPAESGFANRSGSGTMNTPLLSPGLPSSPRPHAMGSGPHSPPLSPRPGGAPPAILSPRSPRQSIPLSLSTPLQTPLPHEMPVLKSPQPLNLTRKNVEPETVSTPTSSRDSAIERTSIFTGFVTEEYPDLLVNPDSLMAVYVRVASSRMKPSRASLISLTQLEEDPVFTLAVLSRADGGELWRVEKDSVSLAKLDAKLKQCTESKVNAKTPDRSLFSGHAPARLDARRRALDQYLEEVLNTPLDKGTAMDICRYLSNNVLPPNADEIGSPTGRDDERGPRIGPGGRQYKSGYLTKRGKNFGGWKARFFVIEGPMLKYYETPGGAHLGTIKLQGAQIGRQSQSAEASSPVGGSDEMDNQYRHAFLILEPKKKDPTSMTKHVLCAESDKERDLWVSVLLPWTSYKDLAEEEAKKAKDRQDVSSGHAKGSSAKKRSQAQSRSQQQVAKEVDESLIGVSYETTKQGDVPSTDHTELNQTPTMTSQPSYAISAPLNPQWIPDPGLHNKMGGLAPTDDKKAKKRSFFGFGPKQRSSSDSADALFNDNPSAPSAYKDVYNGPVRRVFGSPLAEAVKYNSPRDVRVPLPAVIYRCIQYLEARGAINEEGIFRLSGSNVVIKALKERFDHEGDINLVEDEQYHDIHAVASMLKAYLRELPTSILTRDLHLEFVGVTEMNSAQEKIAVLHELVARLPMPNLTLLRYLIAFLIKIIANADRNKMTVRNVGIVFSPTLTIPAPVFALFLQNYEAIFGMSPLEYDLQSPASAYTDDRSDKDSVDLPLRPSTSGGMRESPHRHRLAEALADQRRGNTPPPGQGAHPLGGFPNIRSTPTPPPGQRYESNPYAQQRVGSGSPRPAYEATPGIVNLDPSLYYHAAQRQGPAAYDQPSKSSRRESSLPMALPPRGLMPQGSSSRLREEAQW